MSEDHSGFIYDIKRPTRDADRYVACLVITPKRRDGTTDVGAKVERNIGRAKAVQIASELLETCGAPAELLAQVRALAPTSEGDDTE
jgi:hypothetical protein